MVPVELLVTAMVGGFAVALTAVLATVHVIGRRITDLREDVRGHVTDLREDVRGHVTDLREDMLGRHSELREDLTGRMGELREDLTGRMGELSEEMAGIRDDVTAIRASTAALDARLTTLEQR